MKKHILPNKFAIGLTLVLTIVHFVAKDFSNPYERPISGDAQAYYAYLPAIFIYQDMSFSFVEETNEKYYPKNYEKSFIYDVGDGKKANKTFPGVAVLYTPFFLLAHGLASITSFDADGYSNIYQICFDIGYWFYFCLGLIFFAKVLRKLKFAESTIMLATAVIALGTNVYFYSMYDQSVTHIHNFFMVNALIYYLLLFKESEKYKYLGFAIALLLLIGITRPTNILVVGVVLFFIPNGSFYLNSIRILKRKENVLKTAIILLFIASIPFILWKLQTGKWIVYSYGDEGFNFSDPHIADFLISYTKGWLLYTPIALLILIPGFIQLIKSDKRKAMIGAGFYLLAIYVFSSWWCWYYGAGMSQRVMIDSYLILGFLFAITWEQLLTSKIMKGIYLVAATFLVFVNVAQAWQIRYGVIPLGSATQEQYWDNFLSFERKARVYPPDHWQKVEDFPVNLAPGSGVLQNRVARMIDGQLTVEVKSDQPYSGKMNVLMAHAIQKGSKIKISFEARARHDIEESRLVYYFYPNDAEMKSFMLKDYLVKDEWKTVEVLAECLDGLYKRFEFYFWNGGSMEKVEFRKIRIEHFYSEEYY